jgi:hypothetical protein
MSPEGDTVKTCWVFLISLLFVSCYDYSSGPPNPSSLIVVKVHWQDEGIAGVPIKLVQTGDSVQTDKNGLAVFSVPPGHYIVPAYGINRGGPVLLSIDFDVEARNKETAIVDIVDCLPCL